MTFSSLSEKKGNIIVVKETLLSFVLQFPRWKWLKFSFLTSQIHLLAIFFLPCIFICWPKMLELLYPAIYSYIGKSSHSGHFIFHIYLSPSTSRTTLMKIFIFPIHFICNGTLFHNTYFTPFYFYLWLFAFLVR